MFADAFQDISREIILSVNRLTVQKEHNLMRKELIVFRFVKKEKFTLINSVFVNMDITGIMPMETVSKIVELMK